MPAVAINASSSYTCRYQLKISTWQKKQLLAHWRTATNRSIICIIKIAVVKNTDVSRAATWAFSGWQARQISRFLNITPYQTRNDRNWQWKVSGNVKNLVPEIASKREMTVTLLRDVSKIEIGDCWQKFKKRNNLDLCPRIHLHK
jgi:hypothetical protein